MMWWLYRILLLITVFIIFYNIISSSKERFEAPIIDNNKVLINSLPLDPVTRYPKAYYHELNNTAFEEALRTVLSIPSEGSVGFEPTEWHEVKNDDVPAVVGQVYQSLIVQRLRETIASPSATYFFAGEGDYREPMQIAYEHLMNVSRHNTIPETYWLQMEAVFYREGKFHGKHCVLDVIAYTSSGHWSMKVIKCIVKGVVSEDQIVMWPIVSNDPSLPPQREYKQNPYESSDGIIMDNALVLAEVKRQNKNQQKRAEMELSKY